MCRSRYSCRHRSSALHSHRIQDLEVVEVTLDSPFGTERTVLNILGCRVGKSLRMDVS
uniref:Uncharacterized protein n=1 Tax=Arundo donax TaxID=35708 RepID=A0A0A8YQ40_ARUDO